MALAASSHSLHWVLTASTPTLDAGQASQSSVDVSRPSCKAVVLSERIGGRLDAHGGEGFKWKRSTFS
jgi:hypothetical protein